MFHLFAVKLQKPFSPCVFHQCCWEHPKYDRQDKQAEIAVNQQYACAGDLSLLLLKDKYALQIILSGCLNITVGVHFLNLNAELLKVFAFEFAQIVHTLFTHKRQVSGHLIL